MSADHKDLVFTLNKENAAELIYRNLKKLELHILILNFC